MREDVPVAGWDEELFQNVPERGSRAISKVPAILDDGEMPND